jgi:Domain of unknown function (DUF6265)
MRRPVVTVLIALLAATADFAPAAEPPALGELSWFTGRWVDDSGGNLSEETWSGASGDSMLGMWRYVVDGKARIYEILTITAEDGGIVMRLRHFDPQLVGREDKTTPVVLKLVSSKRRQAVFEGTEVGGPDLVRLTYVSPSDDALTVTLEKQGKKQGFSFRRATR